MLLEYKVKNNDNFQTVKEVLKEHFKVSDALLLKIKKNNLIYLNGEIAFLFSLVKENDVISFSLDFDEDNSNIIPSNIPLEIIYEDEYLLAVNKPSNMAVHPSSYHLTDTLSNGIKYYYDQINLHKKIRIVNRLDRNTSGIVLIAKNEYIQESLIKQMSNHTFEKKYLGFVSGVLNNKSGIINANIARKPNSIIEREINENGQRAITKYNVLKEFDNYSLVEFKLLTGRTHQIRVHTAYINHPLLGDSLYGKSSSLINRQALHCYYIKFIHPITNKEIIITCKMPKDMEILESI